MAAMLDFLISLFEFSSNPILNALISIGIGYLAYKLSYICVGIIAPILFFCGPVMSVVHWTIRFGLVLFVVCYLTQLTLWINIPIAIVGFVCMIYKIF